MEAPDIHPKIVITNKLESYLSEFRNEESIDSVVTTPPPEYSSFYWKSAETKHKVFIPTPNRDIYYSLKEIGPADDDTQDRQERTLKCVSLALSMESNTDRLISNNMETIAHIMEQTIFGNIRSKNPKTGMINDTHCSNLYSITKYIIKDLQDVSLKERYKKKWNEVELTVSPNNDQLIDVINLAFSMSAKRMFEDKNHVVYHYGQQKNY